MPRRSTLALDRMPWRAIILGMTSLCAAMVLGGCRKDDIFRPSVDDHPLSSCVTGDGTAVTLYEDDGGGAAVGTWWRVAAMTPQLPLRQVIYSDDIPKLISLDCKDEGIVLKTSIGQTPFSNREINTLRESPKNLGAEYRRAHSVPSN